MKKHLIATITAFAMSATGAQAEDARGVWSGTIANTLRVIVQFDKPADGPWEATLKVPAQNLVTRVEDVVVTPERIGFALPRLKASYAATWSDQDQAWNGAWTQGQTTSLNLKRTTLEASKPKRPQEDEIAARTPAYASSEVSFENEAAGRRWPAPSPSRTARAPSPPSCWSTVPAPSTAIARCSATSPSWCWPIT